MDYNCASHLCSRLQVEISRDLQPTLHQPTNSSLFPYPFSKNPAFRIMIGHTVSTVQDLHSDWLFKQRSLSRLSNRSARGGICWYTGGGKKTTFQLNSSCMCVCMWVCESASEAVTETKPEREREGRSIRSTWLQFQPQRGLRTNISFMRSSESKHDWSDCCVFRLTSASCAWLYS